MSCDFCVSVKAFQIRNPASPLCETIRLRAADSFCHEQRRKYRHPGGPIILFDLCIRRVLHIREVVSVTVIGRPRSEAYEEDDMAMLSDFRVFMLEPCA